MATTLYIVTFQFNEKSNNGKEKNRIITDQFSKIFIFKNQADNYAKKMNKEAQMDNGAFKVFKTKIENARIYSF